MVRRKRPHGKYHMLSDTELAESDEVKRQTGQSDHDLYNAGVRVAKTIVRTAIMDSPDRFKFGKRARDDLVSEEYQGNQTGETPSEMAMKYFSINIAMWEALSEAEKADYISRLPTKKTKAGGEEMSNRDTASDLQTSFMNDNSRRTFFENEMKILSDIRAKRNRKYIEDRLG